MVAGCGKKQPANTGEDSNTPAKTAKESALEGKVVGAWMPEGGTLGKSDKFVFHKGGACEFWENGEKAKNAMKGWSIKNNEVHMVESDGNVLVFKLNDNGSLEWVAGIEDGKREDFPKEDQWTFKKIK